MTVFLPLLTYLRGIMLKVIVDADACPVKQIIEKVCIDNKIKLIFVSNPHHHIESVWGDVIVVDARSQSADIAIANLAVENDIVVTQDYGLAAMVLGKKTMAINPSGMVYTPENIEGLLMQRFINNKARQRRDKIKGPAKRKKDDDIRFRQNLSRLIRTALEFTE
jgi:uncharacterized protein YaiI (UPF0178 family)